MKERVQKILARAGVASRRKIEEMITEGRVRINAQVAKPVTRPGTSELRGATACGCIV